ncbi:hypothetical protein [Marinilabilia sp.]|uniref:hypothetical protein n=1 Tax=Marinilabilia sp. TaxID=2021252 RepID=UPI0025C0F8C3|nr:hypothetical protein [Marinilabilia sp.]
MDRIYDVCYKLKGEIDEKKTTFTVNERREFDKEMEYDSGLHAAIRNEGGTMGEEWFDYIRVKEQR